MKDSKFGNVKKNIEDEPMCLQAVAPEASTFNALHNY
jgi:hypothetical protein